MRGDFPLHTGKSLEFERPVKAKDSFEQFKGSCRVEPDRCEFVVALNFEESITDLFTTCREGFISLVGEAPESNDYYKSLYDQQSTPSISEQRQMRALHRRLKRLLPDRDFGGMSAVEEMVIGASAVNTNFSRCSSCNLPMYVDAVEDHRCVRCLKENLCNFCLTSHACLD